jgi:hypothetical protein
VISPDELLTPPVFNYSRSLRWASTAETIFMVFKVASEEVHSHPFARGSDSVKFDKNIESNTAKDIETIQYIETIQDINERSRRGSLQDIAVYCVQRNGVQSSNWAPGVFTRMAIASCASLALQWGTVGAAFLVGWFTPTTVSLLYTCS